MSREILIIDIETTHFLRYGGSIVEVGMVSLNLDDGSTTVVFDSMCREKILTGKHREKPFGWIFRNSSLTVEAVRRAPAFEDLQAEMQQLIDQHPLGATAYNRAFDFDFLEDRGIVFPVKLQCPMLLSTPVCKLPGNYGDYKWPKVEEAWAHFFPNHSYVEQHRGADDALHEAAIVFELYRRGLFKVQG